MNTATAQKPFIVSARDTKIVSDLTDAKRDRVHPIQMTGAALTEVFANTRLGGLGASKHCWTTLHDQVDSQASQINASLYAFVQTTPIDDERDFAGNVASILSAPVADLDSDPTAIIFYSVASFKESTRGAGADIINRAVPQYAELYPTVKFSTLSPLRGFSQWLSNEMGESACALRLKDSELKHKVACYLLSNVHGVQKFHMRNGAYVGDINVDANTTGSLDEIEGMNVMINYAYPNDAQREINKTAYASGNLTFAAHLHDIVMAVDGPATVRISPRDLTSPWTIKPAMF